MIFLLILAVVITLLIYINIHRSFVPFILLLVLLLSTVGVLCISSYYPDETVEQRYHQIYVDRILGGSTAVVYLAVDGRISKREYMPVVIDNSTKKPYVRKIVGISHNSFWKLKYETADFEFVTNFDDYKKILERREP